MKRVLIVFLVFTLTLSLLACGSNTAEVKQSSDSGFSVAADWIMYDSLSEIDESADCIVVAEVLSKNSPISVGYTADDFSNFSSLVETDSLLASKMKMSIRTPFSIKIEEVISSDISIFAGDVVDLYQIGGTYCGVTLADSSTVPLEVGSVYVLILKQRITSDSTTYFSMITPIQGYAQIIENDTASRNISNEQTVAFQTHESNHLFDTITSVNDIYDALSSD